MAEEPLQLPYHDKLSEIESSLATAKQKFRSTLSTKRTLLSLGIVIGTLPGSHLAGVVNLSMWAVVPAFVLSLLFIIAGIGTEADKILAEVERLESVKRIYFGFLDRRDSESYFDKLVKINVENLSEYYSLVKRHTQQSFRLSALIVSVGFILMIGGLGVGFFNLHYKDISYVTAGAGLIVNFIGGAVFLLYTKTVLQLKQYHDSLLDVQNILLAFKLVEGAADEASRTAMTQRMIEFLSSRMPLSADAS